MEGLTLGAVCARNFSGFYLFCRQELRFQNGFQGSYVSGSLSEIIHLNVPFPSLSSFFGKMKSERSAKCFTSEYLRLLKWTFMKKWK